MNQGYIAFLKPRNAYERMTALLDGGKFCHVELMIEQNPDGTWQTIQELPDSGVRLRNVTLQGKHWVKIPVEVDIDYCKAWYALHTGQKYDWVGLATTKIRLSMGIKVNGFVVSWSLPC